MHSLKKQLACVAVIFLVTIASPAFSQTPGGPGEYMTAISKICGDMNAKYMQYLSAAAHGRRARKVEKLRLEVIDNINQCKYKVSDLGLYKGDNSLRQGTMDYIQLCYRVFSEDYKKIVNIEELAEQSVDEMQAYLLLQDMVDQKLNEGSAKLHTINQEFAAKYNVNLVSGEKTEFDTKMETAGKLNRYTNAVYLVFFKSNWEDGQMTKAMNNKKVNDVEQARNALQNYAAEGLKALDTLKSFEGDPSLANACRQALEFYKKTAEKDVPKLTDFFLKEEDFEKLKKAYDAKSDHSREEVDAYNKAVKDVNNAIGAFNQTNNIINNGRTQAVNNWTDTEKRFADQHMPHYR